MPRTRIKPDWAVEANLRGLEALQEHRPHCVGYIYCHGINVRKVTVWKPDGTFDEWWSYTIGRGGIYGCGVGYPTRDDAVLAAMSAVDRLRHPEKYPHMRWGWTPDA